MSTGPRARLAFGLCLAALACGPTIERRTLVIPERPDLKALLLVVRGPRETLTRAADWQARAPIELDVDLDSETQSSAEIDALGFPCTLEELGVAAGPFGARLDPRLVTLPALHLEATLRDGALGPWTEPVAIPEWVRDALPFSLSPSRRCVSFRRRELPLSPEGAASSVVLLDETHALVAMGAAAFYVITSTSVRRLPVEEGPSLSGCQDGNGQIWFTDTGGLLRRGTTQRGFEVLDSTFTFTPSVRGVVKLTCRKTPGPEELFFVGSQNTTEQVSAGWWRDGAWRALITAATPRYGAARVDAIWIGEGKALLGAASADGVIVADQGVVMSEPLTRTMQDRATAFAQIPSWGVVVGSQGGGLFAGGPGQWRALVPPSSLLPSYVRAIVPLDGGIGFATNDSEIRQWHPDDAACPSRLFGPGATTSIQDFVPLGDAFLMRMNERIWILERVKTRGCTVDDGTLGDF
ncbi:MAG: hypothetical protein IT384_34305 [Deltaproteobacteria bacterium]|nr:hypothetical protein [Deltaproteobacteria bacterium]